MAVRASGQTPQDAYSRFRREVGLFKNRMSVFLSTAQAGDVGFDFFEQLYRDCKGQSDLCASVVLVSGIQAFAQAQEDENSYNFIVEVGSLKTAIDAGLAWMDANIPDSNLNRPSFENFTTEYPISNTYTSVQTAVLQTGISNIISMIV